MHGRFEDQPLATPSRATGLAEAVEQIPLFNLPLALEPLHEQAVATFDRLWRAGHFTFGPELLEFEHTFADLCGAEHCVGVSDGTTALELGLIALGVAPASRVITVPNTFIGTVEAIAAAGAHPTLVDVDPVHRCMDPAGLERALGDDAGAVVPVHLFGRLAPMEQISALCSRAAVPVLEDAAQAHGASLNGKRAGAWGDAAGFSFYPTKNLGAAGDAGAVVCADAETADVVRSLRHHGSLPGEPNCHVRRGRTARLDNLQAGLLLLRLARLEQENEQRRRAASFYRQTLHGLPVGLPAPDAPGERQVHHLFVIEVPERDRVLGDLRAAGVGAAIHYPTPVHLQPAWQHLGYARGDFPVAEHLAASCLSLPCFPGITERQQLQVGEALTRTLS